MVSTICGNCLYSDPSVMSDGPVLECHRFPPITLVVGDDVTRLFPQVSSDEWCGEFKARTESVYD